MKVITIWHSPDDTEREIKDVWYQFYVEDFEDGKYKIKDIIEEAKKILEIIVTSNGDKIREVEKEYVFERFKIYKNFIVKSNDFDIIVETAEPYLFENT